MSTLGELELEECRAALRKVLESETFIGSRRISGFLSYTANAALEGRTEIDQYEIADKVLGRSTDFRPLDDATVRKLGTQLRQKLDEYYAGPGSADDIIVSLPRRSYIPRFRRKEDEAAAVPPADASPLSAENNPTVPEIVLVPGPPQKSWIWLWGAFVAGALVAGVPWLFSSRVEPQSIQRPSREVLIQTAAGDLRGKTLDIAPDAVQIGSRVHDGEEAITRLRFVPEFPTQQAGLMIMFSPDQYVRLGPHFKNRPLMEFGSEINGEYQREISTYEFDPLGQQGIPRWLSIRRSGDHYRAYSGLDGMEWKEFGTLLHVPSNAADPQSAIYAFNGRSSDPSTTAIFDQFGTAMAFHHRPEGPFTPQPEGGWELQQECAQPVRQEVRQNALQVAFADNALGCNWYFTRPVSKGDWALSALVDFEPVSGSSAGIIVRGAKHGLTLTRRDFNGRSLTVERAYDQDTRTPDFPGTPPVILRFEKKGNIIRASASRDGQHYVPVPGDATLDEIGAVQRIGVFAGIAHWTGPASRPPARIYWIKEQPALLGTLPRGNVP